jgi:hypothetical protein
MAQYAISDADLDDGSWLDELGVNVDLWNPLAPDTPGSIGAGDDSDYIESVANPAGAPIGLGLSTIEDPVSSTGHIMRWRRGKNAAGGAQINLDVELREGYIDEGTPGALVNAFADVDIPDAFATTTDTLTGGEADAIGDYGDLQVRFVATQV